MKPNGSQALGRAGWTTGWSSNTFLYRCPCEGARFTPCSHFGKQRQQLYLGTGNVQMRVIHHDCVCTDFTRMWVGLRNSTSEHAMIFENVLDSS